jgi:hypothetical protein
MACGEDQFDATRHGITIKASAITVFHRHTP